MRLVLGVALVGVVALVPATAEEGEGAEATGPPISLLCMDPATGRVLYEQNADLRRPPASMLKLKLLLLVDEGLDRGDWSLEQPITTSAWAAYMGGTQLRLEEGDTWPLGTLLPGIAVASANDASVAVAEALWGSERSALDAMNRRAVTLGMLDTVYHSTNGLPPEEGEPFDQTTARDMAVLARAVLARPRLMHWLSLPQYQLAPDKPLKRNTNKLMRYVPGCDGLKTGYIRAAGFCVAATAERNGLRLLAVVMGVPGSQARFDLAEQLLEDGFAQARRMRLARAGDAAGPDIRLPNGTPNRIRPVFEGDFVVTARASEEATLTMVPRVPASLMAPLPVGTEVGEMVAVANGEVIGRATLIVPSEVSERGWWLRQENGRVRWEGIERAGASAR